MKNILKYLCSAALLLGAYTTKAQGLENIIVEDYYTITAAEAAALAGTTGDYDLEAGMKVYRVYVDMAPNYKLIQLFGSPVVSGPVSLNPLDITTTTTFWNQTINGLATTPQSRRLPVGGTAFDTYVTSNATGTAIGTAPSCAAIGGGSSSSAGQYGVLKTADPNGNLTLCGVYQGFPATTSPDGHVPGTPGTLTFNLGGTADLIALQDIGSSLNLVNEFWGVVGGQQGVDPATTNRILIGQFTTAGTFSFHLNVQLQSPGSVLETYVWNQVNPTANPPEQFSALLTYPGACTPPQITSATSNSPICSNQTLNLSSAATGTAPITFVWSGAGTVVNGANGSATVTGAATGNYTLTVSNACGSPTQTTVVVVNAATNWYADTDGDGFGAGAATLSCTQPNGTVANNTDLCPTDPNKQAPGACGCGVADVATTYYADTDGDGFGAGPAIPGFTCISLGVTNNTDLCPTDPNKQAPGACGCGVADVAATYYADTDGDGFGAGPAIPGFTCISLGVTNNTDLCPTDPNKQAPGTCGCGVADVAATYYADTDGDGFGAGPAIPGFTCISLGVTNNTDLCPTDPNKQAPGACGCGVADVAATYYADTDGDGFGAGPAIPGFTCISLGVTNNTDLCPTDPNKQAPGACGCGVADVATTYYADTDGDGFGAGPAIPGFTCISLGVTNNTDLCPTDPNKQAPGACGCGVADVAATYYADTDGDGFGAGPAIPGFTCISLGVTNNTDLCPTDPNKQAPGTCGCGVADVAATYYADTDGDGFGAGPAIPGFTCISLGVTNNTDNCPTLSGLIGDVCNDGNAGTINDVITTNCVCAGTQPNDCLGVPGGSAQPGTACNDNNPATGNDTWSANCVCVGQLIDCLGIAGGSALPGTACNDNNACTIGDVYNATCQCAGTIQDTDGDGICNADDDCPNLAGEQGDACNDGNTGTINDVITANCVCAGVQPNDCLGQPGGPAQPGTACNDNNPTTGNDTWSASCVCVGQLIDCLGVAGGPALPGTVCNDNNACTIGDVYNATCQCAGTIQDTDGDGICNADDDCPNLAGEQGDACNDGNTGTINDVITANCVCAGVQPNDCLGQPGGPAQPGTSCNDNNPATGNDTWSANCVCVGQLIDCLGVVGGPALPGTACNDNSACTIGDVYNATCQCAGTIQDTDGDGICNADDDCPNLAGEQGDACNDGNANTNNDVINANCVCVGVAANDCLGVPGGAAQPGTSCNDNNPATGNDTWSANCMCVGQLIDCLGVAGGSALPGTACNDNNPNTSGDVYGANCVCAGVLANDCLGVPGGPAVPGSACNDNNPNTSNDVYSANCVCAGTPVSGCDNWTLEITTDNAGSETTWEVRNATTLAVVDAGGPYASNTTTIETVCLPPAACYQLIVTDANGMSNGTVGGYVMRDQNGKRVLDNANDGVFTGTSQAVRPFCSPVGDLTILTATIDKTTWLLTDYVVASADPAVAAQFGIGDQTDDGYEFWFFNPDGGYDRQIYVSNANPVVGAQPGANAATYLRLNQISNAPPPNVLLNLRVRSRVNGVQAGWGPVSRFKIDPVAAQCPTAQLVPYAGSQFSCGATKTVGATGSNGQIVSTVVSKVVNGNTVNANRFWFAFTEPNTGYVRNAWTTTRTLVLSKWTTAPLLCGTNTYTVIVRASFDGGTTWCPAGSACTVTITNNFAAPFCTPVGSAFTWAEDRIFTDGDEPAAAMLTMWPNPNRGEELNLTIDALNSDVTTANLDMYDMYGKKVMSRILAVNGSSLTAVVRMETGLAAGIYVVNVTAGDQTFTQRLVIQ